MFFPIKSNFELARLRSLMSPFMVNIQKCFNFTEHDGAVRERIVDGVINSIDQIVDPELLDGLNQIMMRPGNITLCHEHDALRQISLR